MALKLKRKGDTSYLQDHNLLKNTDLNDQHPIKAITGLQDELDSINTKLENGDIGGGGGGTPTQLKYTSVLEYSGSKLVREVFTGDINKTVDYYYDGNGNVIRKAVTNPDSSIVDAIYTYDENSNLIGIKDNGVEEIYVAGGSGGGGGAIDISPLVDRVKTLEQNIGMLDSNDRKLLNAVSCIYNEIMKMELKFDNIHDNTNSGSDRFTDTMNEKVGEI